MALLSLPTKLIYRITSFLPSYTIQSLAQTYNHCLYEICAPFLVHRIASQRNTAARIVQFNGAAWMSQKSLPTLYAYAGFEDLYGPFIKHPNPSYDYLDLNGDFSWLGPLDPEMDQALEDAYTGKGCWAMAEQLDKLVEQAEQLGVRVPDDFISFMLSDEHQKKTITPQYSHFRLESLHQLPSRFDAGEGGYIIPFFCGSLFYHIWALYLARDKGSCVIKFPLKDLKDHNNEDLDTIEDTVDYALNRGFTVREAKATRKMGVKMVQMTPWSTARDIVLAAPSFEEYLVKTHFEKWCLHSMCYYQKLTENQKEYIANLANIAR